MGATAAAVPLVLLDDGGEFRLYRSEGALLASQESPEGTRGVIDPIGRYYQLRADRDGGLQLSSPLGPVEHYTLRQQFLARQHIHPEAHRLLRRYPRSREDFMEMLFQELELEDPADGRAWTATAMHQSWRCNGLQGVDSLVAHTPGPVLVTDPFGHRYRPRTVRHGRIGRRLRGRPLYIEIGP